MTNFQVDLTNCDREPIHIPAQIQSHGFLLVVDNEHIIRFYSDNIKTFIPGITGNILGRPLTYIEQLISITKQVNFITQLINISNINKSFEQINPCKVEILGASYYLIISNTNGYYLLEFEQSMADFDIDIQKMIGHSVAEMLADKSLDNLLTNSAKQIKNIINYDRVMIYRFAEDGHGEVVAEAKNDDLGTWLGLHYPASDIPKQARELYKLNLTRLIANVYSEPSPIVTEANNTEPLDLTYSQLRAVSPIHIQYLKNMGVASSFSISIIYKKELWGLIACHNYKTRFIDYKSRESSKLIGQILSSAIEFRHDEVNQHINETLKNNVDIIARNLQKVDNIEDALTKESVTLLDVVHATGAIFVYENTRITLGVTPDEEQLNGLINWIEDNVTENLYHTTNISAVYEDAAVYKNIASGVLMLVISKELGEYVFWFKPEQLKNIKWAGNPDKPVEINENGLMQISPRHSFEEWSQTVTGTSVNWGAEEIISAVRLKEEITYAINQKAGAIRLLNEKLRQAYDELDTFSYTISHDLKNPISAIKSYAQLLNRDKTISERGQQILNKIAERADKMNFMINEVLNYSSIGRSEIDYRKINTGLLINDIVKDLELIYDTSNLQITIGKTPDIHGDPLMLLQVFSNLIGNAVKYSQQSNPAIIHIEGTITDNDICYTIKDNGLGIMPTDLITIFDLFNRMDNVKNIEGSGVGLAIVKRIIDKHRGRVWAESELNKGSTFYAVFNKAS